MTYDELVKVNSEIKTTDIKDKAYAEVKERIKAFRKLFPNGTIVTEIIRIEDGVAIIKATAMASGVILGTGHAYEKEGSTFINKTSYIENAETSAVGRCLGMIGIGIDTAVASYEETANAIKQQESDKKKADKKAEPKNVESTPKTRSLTEEDKIARNKFLETCSQYDLDPATVAKQYGLLNGSSPEAFYAVIDDINGGNE